MCMNRYESAKAIYADLGIDTEKVLEKLSGNYPVFMPLEKSGEANYGLWEKGAKTALDKLKTVKSPKDLFFPQSETLMKFKTSTKTISIEDTREEVKPFVLLGAFNR